MRGRIDGNGGGHGRPWNDVASRIGGGGRNRTGVHGFAGRCMTTLPPRPLRAKRESSAWHAGLSLESGAGDESRTRDLNLGKVTLYQLSHSRETKANFTVAASRGSSRSGCAPRPARRASGNKAWRSASAAR